MKGDQKMAMGMPKAGVLKGPKTPKAGKKTTFKKAPIKKMGRKGMSC
jgi:hypothetical protein